MRSLLPPALCLALVACSSVPTTGGGTTPSSPSASSESVATDVIRFTNEQRVRNGLPAFVTSSRLMDAARIHAQQMAQFQRMDHTISGATYPTLQSRLDAVGYRYASAAENVAWNNQTPQRAVSGWMNSAGHRANIMNPDLTEIGAAMARSAKGESYWIQVFGRPR